MQPGFLFSTGSSSYRSHFKALKITIFSKALRQLHRASRSCSFKLVLPILKVKGWRAATARCEGIHPVPLLTGTLAAPGDTMAAINPASLCSPEIPRQEASNQPLTHLHTGSCHRGASANGTHSREPEPRVNGKGPHQRTCLRGRVGTAQKSTKMRGQDA